MNKSFLLAAGLAAAFAAASARADESHFQRYIVGERAAGMGGVAVAGGTGTDASIHNPAGLAWTGHDSLSLSANLYGFQKEKTKGADTPGSDEKSFVTIPAAMGGVKQLSDRLTAGFAVFQPNRTSSGDIVSRKGGSWTYADNHESQSIWFGPSAGWKASDTVSVGLGIYGIYSTLREDEDVYSTDYELLTAQHAKCESAEILAILGVQWALPENWRVGATVQTPTLHLTGSGKMSLNSRADAEGYGLNYYNDDLDARDDLPCKLAAGIVRQEERKYAYGLDLTYHLAHNYKMLEIPGEDGDMTMWVRRRGVLDVNLGGEYYIDGRFPVRAGFFTSFAAARDIEADDTCETSDVDLYGATCSIGYETDRTAFNVGLCFACGKGDDVAEDLLLGYVRRDSTIVEVLATMSTSYYF